MDVHRLELLRELADRGSVAAVAAAVHRTPSAVSQQLKALEREAGAALVEPWGRGVRLTAAGRVLADAAVDVATALARLEATWQAHRGAVSGEVVLATFPSAGRMLLPGLLTRLAAHPDLHLDVRVEDVAQEDFPALTSAADVVVAHHPDEARPWRETPGGPLLVRPLLREPLDVAVPREHPLAARERVRPEDLVDETWIGVPEGYPFDLVLERLGVLTGRAPRVGQRVVDLGVAQALVGAGHGIALVPRFTAGHDAGQRFRLLPLAGLRAGRQVDALVRRDRAERRAVGVVLDALAAEAAAVAAAGER